MNIIHYWKNETEKDYTAGYLITYLDRDGGEIDTFMVTYEEVDEAWEEACDVAYHFGWTAQLYDPILEKVVDEEG